MNKLDNGIPDQQLYNYLKSMDIPDFRKNVFNKNGIEWLYKNLAKRNSEHANFDKAYSEIKYRYENKIYNS